MTERSERPTWYQAWEHVAMAIAGRSLCSRAQVGAVIVDTENRIVSVGYNGPPAGFDHQDKSCLSWCPRAKPPIMWEGNLNIVDASLTFEFDTTYLTLADGTTRVVTDDDMPTLGYTRKEVLKDGYTDCVALHAEANALSVCDRSRRIGGTIYVTSAVCWTCAKLIANSGLAAVVVSVDSTDRSYRDPGKSYELLESCGIEVIINE